MKILGIIVICVATLIGGCFVSNWYGWHRMKTGYEVKVKDYAPYLQERLEEDLGYQGFEHQWLQEAWVNGFQDHTYLFLVTGDTKGLKEAVESATGNNPIQSTYFSSGNYLGPSTAPDWWNTVKIDAADSRYFEKNSNFWRFTWIDNRLYIVYCN
jgi:hypothetical protein